jgi:ankyrin repeat protein
MKAHSEHGADPRMTISVAGVMDYTTLHHAALLGMVSFVQFLVEHGAGVNARDSRGYTPLSQAMRCDPRLSSDEASSQIVEYLASVGADFSVLGECETLKNEPFGGNCPNTRADIIRLACATSRHRRVLEWLNESETGLGKL